MDQETTTIVGGQSPQSEAPSPSAPKGPEDTSQVRVERYGETGVIVRGPGGIFGKGTRSPAQITPQNAHEYHRMRQQKTARLLREAIVAETIDKLELPGTGTGPAEAVAAAGGILWREIVLNQNSYDRDRLEAFDKIGKHAGMLSEAKQAPALEAAASIADQLHGLAAIARALKQASEQADD